MTSQPPPIPRRSKSRTATLNGNARPVEPVKSLPEKVETPEPESTPEPTIVAPAARKRLSLKRDWNARPLVWFAFIIGIAASITANVAHAEPEIGPRLAGAFVPIALLLSVESMSRPTWHRKGWFSLARFGGTGLVAAVTAIVSYRHMYELMLRFGEDTWNALLYPLSVDGLMVVAGFALLATKPKENRNG